MTDTADSPDDELEAAITHMLDWYGRALAIVADSSGYDGYLRATRLVEAVGEFQKPPADYRVAYAAEIAEQEKLSLRGLAARISVSTTRAKQLRDAAAKERGDSDE